MSKSRPTMMGSEPHTSRGDIFNDASICDTEAATVKVSNTNTNTNTTTNTNTNSNKMSVSMESVARIMANAVSTEAEFLCFSQFRAMLNFIQPKSLISDVKQVQEWASDDGHTDDQLTSKIGHLFREFEITHLHVPDEDPPYFSNINRRKFFLRPPTKREKLRRMLKQFKKSLNKTVVLDRKIADVLVRYLVLKLYHIIPSLEEGSIAPLSGGSTAIGKQEYFFQWIEENVGLEQEEIIEQCVGDFLARSTYHGKII